MVTEGLRYPSRSMTCLISTALSQPVQKRRPNERALVSKQHSLHLAQSCHCLLPTFVPAPSTGPGV